MTQPFNFNERCDKLLADYRRRNGNRTAKRLEEIRRALRRSGYETVQTMFGGSVKRGTYVSGLSDEDALLIVNQTGLDNRPPSDAIKSVHEVVQERFPNNCVVPGKFAVTIKFAKGPEMQILPAIRSDSNGIRIAKPGSSRWSKIIRPEIFASKLTKIDKSNGNRVIPVIKLAKTMANCHIKQQDEKIRGYHMEALAVDAFNGYGGKKDSNSMLIQFLEYSMRAVLSPIDDLTGQTRFVDGYLGTANSKDRERARTYFGQMRGEVKRCETPTQFNNLFCVGN